MTKLTTHALDTYSGKPAKGMKVDVYVVSEKREKIKSVVLNNDGRPDEVLVETIKTGNYELVWDASQHSSGVYFVNFQAGSYSTTKKLMLIK